MHRCRAARAALVVAGALAALLAGTPGSAAQSYLFGVVDEVKGGVLLHDALRHSDESQTIDLNAELVFAPLWRFETGNRFLDFLVNPRPMVGGSLHTEGDTHQAYGGLDWMHQFGNGFFAEASFGITVHSGRLEQERTASGAFVSERQVSLGNRWLFRESLDLGYRFAGKHGLALHYSHMSNAGLDSDNDGMDFVGLRYSYKFGPTR